MAKDRFSRFKKSNYNTTFRYGNTSMNHIGVGKREELNQQQIDWIINVIQKHISRKQSTNQKTKRNN